MTNGMKEKKKLTARFLESKIKLSITHTQSKSMTKRTYKTKMQSGKAKHMKILEQEMKSLLRPTHQDSLDVEEENEIELQGIYLLVYIIAQEQIIKKRFPIKCR